MKRKKAWRAILYVLPAATFLNLAPGMILAQDDLPVQISIEDGAAAPAAEGSGDGQETWEIADSLADGLANQDGSGADQGNGTAVSGQESDGQAGAGETDASGTVSGPASDTQKKEKEAACGPAAEIAKKEAEQTAEDGQAETAESGEEAQEAVVKKMSYTDEELYVMAHVLAGECQNCPDTEQLYVGSVVLNRKNHPSFPKTIKGVVFQKGQYACTWDGNYNREPTERNWANAKKLLEEGSILPGHVIFQSGFKQGKGVYLKTQYHYYCY